MPTFIESADAAASSSTTYSLTAGQSIQGTLTGSGDHDWYRVTLTAGQTYTFALSGTGTNNVIDTFLRLYAADGSTALADNDDGLPNLNSTITYTATTSGSYYLDVSSFQPSTTGQYQFTYNTGTRIGFDTSMGAGVIDTNYAWNSTPGNAVTVTYGFRDTNATYAGTVTDHNLSTFSRLTASEMATVRNTLRMWSEVCNINFVEQNPGGYTNSATILFSNYTDSGDGSGAFAYYPGSTLATDSAGDVWLNTASISTTQTLDYGSYGFFAIMHELGHAIGLSHPGLYNAAPGLSITYANNAQFTQDTQQYTIMSYFDETSTGGNFGAYANSPMLFDIYAAQRIYGANMTTRNTNTTYGFNSNAGAPYNFTTSTTRAFCIWDGGGTDTIDASGYFQNQTINLNAESFSNLGGLTSNISIAAGVVIENATGGFGADTITGNDAANILIGNGGNDTLLGGEGNDTLDGGTGSDVMNGGGGNDTVTYALATAAISLSLMTGTGSANAAGDTYISIENVTGSAFNDVLVGNGVANRLLGGNGNDQFAGQGGGDFYDGGDGVDTIFYDWATSGVSFSLTSGQTAGAAAGDSFSGIENVYGTQYNDVLVGNNVANRLYGGNGDDQFAGQGGGDFFDGGAGIDTIFYDWATSAVSFSLTSGQTAGAATGDSFSGIENVYGTQYNDVLVGNNVANRLYGGNGNDQFAGQGGGDFFDGGAGIDTVFYDWATSGVSFSLTSGQTSGAAAGDSFSGIENVYGTQYNDVLVGNNAANRLYGGNGNDQFAGHGGGDFFDGGAGIDTIFYDWATSGISLSLASGQTAGGSAGDSFSGIENIYGSIYNDVIVGDASNNRLYGGAGDDNFEGDAGSDFIDGGNGYDTVFFTGVTANYSITHAAAGEWTLTHLSTGTVDTLTGVERLYFMGNGGILT